MKSARARKAVEKTRGGKVPTPKQTFPPRLEIPQKPNPRDFHFSHSFGCCCIHDEQLSNKWGHFYRVKNGDISIELRHGSGVDHRLLSLDTLKSLLPAVLVALGATHFDEVLYSCFSHLTLQS